MLHTNHSSQKYTFSQIVVWGTSLFAMAIFISVMIGWTFDIILLKSILPHFIAMKVNTAICLGLLALGSLLNRNVESKAKLPVKLLKLFPTLLVLTIALLTLWQYQFDVNFGIDELFFKDPPPPGVTARFPPGRLAPITGTLFILLSVAQVFFYNPFRKLYHSGQALLFITFLSAFQAVMGYVWGVTTTFGVAYHTQMALNTALGIIALSIGIMASRPREGWISLLSSDTAGGTMGRQLLIWALVVPPLVQGFIHIGQANALFNEDFGGVLKVTGNIVFFVIMTLKTAWALHISDLKKRAEEKKTRELLVEKEAGDAIKESETRLRAIFEATFDAILGMDNRGLITDWNIQAEKMFGWKIEEVIGKRLSDYIIPEKYREAHELGMRHFLKTGEGPVLNKTIEIEGLRRSGEHFPIQLSIKPIFINQKYIFMAFISDITERKLNEAELIKAKQNAIDAAHSKSVFLANMSHEIRTPLNGIIGMTDLLLETQLDDQQNKYARIVQNSGSGLLSIINDILDFSKIDAGKLNLEIIEFNPMALVEEQAEILASRASEKGISLLTFFDHSVPLKVKGDPGRVGQILLNLISNAIKFTIDGRVLVKLEANNLDSDNAQLKFSIHDTGIGLSSDKVARLFQPFTQADESTARKYGGTGLGLSICKQLVDLMGGEIGVESVEGKGSVFTFSIPLAVVSSSALIFPAMSRPLKVLIVDDDPVAREVLGHYLKAWQMTTVEASCGRDALQILRAEKDQSFDLAIIDHRMAPIDGMELASIIKSDEKLAELPLIMLSAFDKKNQGASSSDPLFKAHISKPFKQSDLYDVMTSAMNIGRVLQTRVSQSTKAERPDLTHIRILVAEDNQVNQLLTLTQLKKLGFSAQGVGNGKEVIESLRNDAFDLILMDCQMPEMDGFEATRVIRELENVSGKRIPIIALTANAMKEDQDNCMAAGMDDFVSKPTKRDVLNQVILKWIVNVKT